MHSGDTLENYVVPSKLRMNAWDMNLDSGMEVIKVSKVRKLKHLYVLVC